MKAGKYKYYIFSFLILCNIQALTQTGNKNLVATPNSASLGVNSQIPVNHFIGTPNIAIPVYEFKSGNITVPINLSYKGGGVRPSEKASWVGLGWSLSSGGVITRVVNDLPDEFINYTQLGLDVQSSNNCNSFATCKNANKNGFFYNYNVLSASDWATTKLQYEFTLLHSSVISGPTDYYNLTHRKDKAPDEFIFNFQGMAGSLIMDNTGVWRVKSKDGVDFKVDYETGPYIIVEPTTFSCGTVIYNCLNRFILTSKDGTKYYFGADSVSNINITKLAHGIGGTIVTNWGPTTKNFNSPDSNAIEFSRIGTGGGDCIKGRDGGTVPISWYLTKIVTPNGDEVSFRYSRDGYQITNNNIGTAYTFFANGGSPSSAYEIGTGTFFRDQLTITDGITLSSIIGANGSVKFVKSRSNAMDWVIINPWDIPYSTRQLFLAYSWELFNGTVTENTSINPLNFPSKHMKLDEIQVLDNNLQQVDKFTFQYTETPANRLFLNSFKRIGRDGGSLPATQFTYISKDSLQAIPYETIEVDHWGYYNKKNPLTNLSLPSCSPGSVCIYTGTSMNENGTSYFSFLPWYFNSDFQNTYKSNRNPNTTYSSWGVLKDITYPTGGKTEFVWEANTYSKHINQTDIGNYFSISIDDQLTASQTGPGLRIKQIKSYDGPLTQAAIKSFYYHRGYVNQTSTLSSGVLNSSLPQYVDSFHIPNTYKYLVWNSFNNAPTHLSNGSLITYSKVQEVNADGSFIEHEFTNHDNGYIDKIPAAAVWYQYKNFNYQQFRTNTAELERGLLLKESFYKNDFTLLKQNNYLYNNDPSRFTSSIRRYLDENKFSLAGTIIRWDQYGNPNDPSAVLTPGPPIYKGANLYALEFYTHYPFLKSVSSTQYDQSGLNPVTNVSLYSYDAYRNSKTITTTNSIGDTIVSSTKYSNDNISGLTSSALQGKALLVTSGMSGIPLENTITNNGSQTKYSRTDFKSYPILKPFPVAVKSFEAYGTNSAEQIAENTNHSNKGRLLMTAGRDGVPLSYDWGYSKEYPIVQIVNAVNSQYDSVYIANTSISTTTPSQLIGGSAGSGYSSSVNFNHTQITAISLSIPGSPFGAEVTVNYTLTGPSSQSGTLCTAGNGSNCSSFPSSVTFSNMPIGVYTLNYWVSTGFQSYSFGSYINYSYVGPTVLTATLGVKEFFYEGFEESTLSSVATNNPRTGRKYLNANYTTAFNFPSSKNYQIQWWNYANGKWNFNQQALTSNTTLIGPVDDIRIFPVDAQMKTYTYDLLIGVTSETDPNGKATFYEYDSFNRLVLIRDQDRNIIKKICYNYAGQIDICTDAPSWQLTGNTRCKPCSANPLYTSNILQNEKKDLNPNSPTYNQTIWEDSGVSSNCVTEVWQNEGYPYCEVDGQSNNTGNQLQLQRNVNPCSSTYNNTRVLLLGYNPYSCPVSYTCNYNNCNGEGYKCVNNNCEFGYKVYTDSYWDYSMGMVVCVYHYEWSDWTWSGDYYEYGGGWCPIQ